MHTQGSVAFLSDSYGRLFFLVEPLLLRFKGKPKRNQPFWVLHFEKDPKCTWASHHLRVHCSPALATGSSCLATCGFRRPKGLGKLTLCNDKPQPKGLSCAVFLVERVASAGHCFFEFTWCAKNVGVKNWELLIVELRTPPLFRFPFPQRRGTKQNKITCEPLATRRMICWSMAEFLATKSWGHAGFFSMFATCKGTKPREKAPEKAVPIICPMRFDRHPKEKAGCFWCQTRLVPQLLHVPAGSLIPTEQQNETHPTAFDASRSACGSSASPAAP